jgi:1,2-phenylacetyl-CoA epoxidase PaaB subunit
MRTAAKSASKQVYKVTGTVYVEANNVRHAAHIAKGTFQMKENGPAIFVVEERSISFGAPYVVDLAKNQGEQGYAELVHGAY